jgi:hypothetical protein
MPPKDQKDRILSNFKKSRTLGTLLKPRFPGLLSRPVTLVHTCGLFRSQIDEVGNPVRFGPGNWPASDMSSVVESEASWALSPPPMDGCPILRVLCEGWDSQISPVVFYAFCVIEEALNRTYGGNHSLV